MTDEQAIETLKTLKAACGLKQRQVATVCGVGEIAVSNWLRGVRSVPQSAINALRMFQALPAKARSEIFGDLLAVKGVARSTMPSISQHATGQVRPGTKE